MKVIYKYELNIGVLTKLYVPKGSQILSIGMQDGKPMAWVMIDDTQVKVCRAIDCVFTGEDLTSVELGPYIGTLHIYGGAIVAHYFDAGEVGP